MAITLGIDTTGPSCSLALLRGAELVASIVDPSVGTAEQFLPQLQRLLVLSRVELNAIERIAVCSGPGSFTGIRTGFASAQGIAFVNRLPVLGVSSLLCRLLPHFYKVPQETVAHFVPMVKAREGEFYRCELKVSRAASGSFAVDLVGEVGVSFEGEAPPEAVVLDELEGSTGAALAAESFDLCVELLGRSGLVGGGGVVEGLCQLSSGGLGLLPVYIKPVNAKTLEERFGNGAPSLSEIR